jgi:hypothetical protein
MKCLEEAVKRPTMSDGILDSISPYLNEKHLPASIGKSLKKGVCYVFADHVCHPYGFLPPARLSHVP